MQHTGAVQHGGVQLLRPQAGVRTGLPGKGKAPLPPVVQHYEGQRGKHILRQHQSRHVDACVQQHLSQELAVHIVAHLAQKGRPPAEAGGGGQHIGGRSAGITLEKPHAARGHAAVGKVDQQLPQRRDIVPGAHALASGYSLHSRR